MDVHGRLTNINQNMFSIGARPFDNHIKPHIQTHAYTEIAQTGNKMFLRQLGTTLLVQTCAELYNLDTK